MRSKCLFVGAGMAIMFATLSKSRAEEPQPGKQVEQRLELDGGQTIEYLLYLPEDHAPEDGDKKWPLMLFLHGRGESDGPLSLVAKWGPPRLVEQGESLPYVLVSPQCPREDSWRRETQQAMLVKLLDHITDSFRVDSNRVYLTGLSMGGYGSWRLAADHPERFAAVVPVCGGGDPEDADKLKGLPIWAWHGDEDRAVPITRSVEMVEAIRAAGGEKIRFTTLEGVGHNSWSAAYATPEVYEWLNRQTKQ
jgi:predicted peptidase